MKNNFCALLCSKRTVITVAATLVAVVVVVAIACGVMRGHKRDMMKNPEAMAQYKAEKMAKRYDLDDAQKTKLQTLLAADIKSMIATRSAMMEKKKATMKAVLTPAQYAAWEKKMEKKWKKWQN